MVFDDYQLYLEKINELADKAFSETNVRTEYSVMSDEELQREGDSIRVSILGRAFENFSIAISPFCSKRKSGRGEGLDASFTRDVLLELDARRLAVLEDICAKRG